MAPHTPHMLLFQNSWLLIASLVSGWGGAPWGVIAILTLQAEVPLVAAHVEKGNLALLGTCGSCKARWETVERAKEEAEQQLRGQRGEGVYICAAEEEGKVHVAGPGARRSDVQKPHHEYQMHRDYNAAWNLWKVAAAKYLGLPSPAYLGRSAVPAAGNIAIVGDRHALIRYLDISGDLMQLRSRFQHLFSLVQENSSTRLKDFINQHDALGVATFVSECLKCCS